MTSLAVPQTRIKCALAAFAVVVRVSVEIPLIIVLLHARVPSAFAILDLLNLALAATAVLILAMQFAQTINAVRWYVSTFSSKVTSVNENLTYV